MVRDDDAMMAVGDLGIDAEEIRAKGPFSGGPDTPKTRTAELMIGGDASAAADSERGSGRSSRGSHGSRGSRGSSSRARLEPAPRNVPEQVVLRRVDRVRAALGWRHADGLDAEQWTPDRLDDIYVPPTARGEDEDEEYESDSSPETESDSSSEEESSDEASSTCASSASTDGPLGGDGESESGEEVEWTLGRLEPCYAQTRVVQVDYYRRLRTTLCDDLVRIGSIDDGSCFFHAILRATSSVYRALGRTGRQNMADRLRKALKFLFSLDDFYALNHGLTSEIMLFDEVDKMSSRRQAKVKELCLKEMRAREPGIYSDAEAAAFRAVQQQIRTSTNPDVMTFLGFLCKVLHINIYFFSKQTADKDRIVREAVDVSETYRPERMSVVVYNYRLADKRSSPGHFELVGRKEADGRVTTVFPPGDKTIKAMQTCLTTY